MVPHARARAGARTPGWFDLRELAARRSPASLAGKRCLDVGTFDGFWAFEMERRGAAEVVAVDVLDPRRWDWPASSTEAVVAAARRAQGARRRASSSRARRSARRSSASSSASTTSTRTTLGEFDFVYVGSLLLHLRDPVGALTRGALGMLRRAARVVDAIDLALRSRSSPPAGRRPSRASAARGGGSRTCAALARMVEAAGFELAGTPQRVTMPPGAGHPPRPSAGQRQGAAQRLRPRRGRGALDRDPHCAIAAKPRPRTAPSAPGSSRRGLTGPGSAS